jgi:hypothetical protein
MNKKSIPVLLYALAVLVFAFFLFELLGPKRHFDIFGLSIAVVVALWGLRQHRKLRALR